MRQGAGDKLGYIFLDHGGVRLRLGALYHNSKTLHAMLGADIVAIITVCRMVENEKIRACCIPYPSIVDPPYIEANLQVCLPKNKRLKIGYIFTASDQRGPAYQVVLLRDVVMKLWDMVFVHIHPIDIEEESKDAED